MEEAYGKSSKRGKMPKESYEKEVGNTLTGGGKYCGGDNPKELTESVNKLANYAKKNRPSR